MAVDGDEAARDDGEERGAHDHGEVADAGLGCGYTLDGLEVDWEVVEEGEEWACEETHVGGRDADYALF